MTGIERNKLEHEEALKRFNNTMPCGYDHDGEAKLINTLRTTIILNDLDELICRSFVNGALNRYFMEQT